MASIRRNAPIVKQLPSRELLLERLNYDAERGVLMWRHRPAAHFRDELQFKAWNSHHAGKVAGYRQKRYQYIGIGEEQFMAHRLVWAMMVGPIPEGMLIDHIDGDGHNNRLSNLRLATACDNQRNQTPRARSSSGFTGVYLNKRLNKWAASVRVNGKLIHLGMFSDAAAAAEVATAARRQEGYTERHLGKTG